MTEKRSNEQIGAMAQHKSFVNRAEVLIEAFRNNVMNMLPTKGDTASESQKIALICSLNQLEATINGTTVEDFIK
jgi:hypothetical protein